MKVYTVEYQHDYEYGYEYAVYKICKTRELAEKRMLQLLDSMFEFKDPSTKEKMKHGFEVVEWEIDEEE